MKKRESLKGKITPLNIVCNTGDWIEVHVHEGRFFLDYGSFVDFIYKKQFKLFKFLRFYVLIKWYVDVTPFNQDILLCFFKQISVKYDFSRPTPNLLHMNGWLNTHFHTVCTHTCMAVNKCLS